MSTSVSLELTDDQIRRLDRAALKEKRSQTETAAHLLETALRIYEYPHVVFRDFGAGIEAFILGSRLRVWWIATPVDGYEGDVAKAAEHVNISEDVIRGALRYAEAFPDEIAAEIEANDRRHEEMEKTLADLETLRLNSRSDDAPPPPDASKATL